MEDELKKHAEARKRSEKIFREIDRAKEHFLEASRKVTSAEKHLEEAEKEKAQVERSIQETEASIKNTQESIVQAHEGARVSKPSKPEKGGEPSSKSPPLKRQSG